MSKGDRLMGIIKHYFMPNAYVKSVFEINIDKLADTGVKGIITDLDNTLVGWDVVAPTEQIKQWFKDCLLYTSPSPRD